MRTRRLAAALLAAGTMTMAASDGASAAEAPDCTTGYLLCLNEATQEESGFWRQLKELECGAAYAGCVRRKLMGA